MVRHSMTGNGSEMVTDDGYHQYAAFELLMSLDKEIRKEVLGALGGVGGMNRPSIINHWYDCNDVPRPQATLERHQKRRAAEHPQRRVFGDVFPKWPARRTRKADKQVWQHVVVVIAVGIMLTIYAVWAV